MTLTVTDRKYYKAYDGSGNLSRWQTEVVAADIVVLLRRHSIPCEVTSDEFETLISWSTPGMQLWIGIECIDADAPSFELRIGAGKRVLLIFSRAFPDSSFTDEPWLTELRQLAKGPNPQGGASGRQPSSSGANRTSAAAASRRSP
jgi:hypothetical protein